MGAFGLMGPWRARAGRLLPQQGRGLKAIIAIHATALGPALGGCRMWPYASEDEALTDVLRLSRGMTYKAAVAGLNLGGGKAVIIGDAKKDKTRGAVPRLRPLRRVARRPLHHRRGRRHRHRGHGGRPHETALRHRRRTAHGGSRRSVAGHRVRRPAGASRPRVEAQLGDDSLKGAHGRRPGRRQRRLPPREATCATRAPRSSAPTSTPRRSNRRATSSASRSSPADEILRGRVRRLRALRARAP